MGEREGVGAERAALQKHETFKRGLENAVINIYPRANVCLYNPQPLNKQCEFHDYIFYIFYTEFLVSLRSNSYRIIYYLNFIPGIIFSQAKKTATSYIINYFIFHPRNIILLFFSCA